MELMDYDLKLQHKAGSKMIVADALSRHADWLKGIDQDNVDVVALPDALWIKLVDTELQDAVADVQKNNKLALRSLTDPSVSPSRWTIVSSGSDSSTIYCSIMDASISLIILACDTRLSVIITIL